MVLLDYNLDYFYSYIYNSKKYKAKLEIAISNELWDYAAILTWKSTILFVYEKLYQINYLTGKLPEEFQKVLKKDNMSCNSCFNFSCIDDDTIYNHLNKIWHNVEKNYKSLFKSLLDERNSLSHVNIYEDNFNEQYFKTYFDKSLRLVKYFQNLNNSDISEKLYEFILCNNTILYISEQDSSNLLSIKNYNSNKINNYLLESRTIFNYSNGSISHLKLNIINDYLNSLTFAKAMENGKRILSILNYLNKEDIILILEGIFNNQGENNQIVFAADMESVFLEIFNRSINFEDLEIYWGEFIKRLIECDKNRYAALKNNFLEIYGKTI